MTVDCQEEHIGHVKQLKSDRYQDLFFFSSIAYVHSYFPKIETLTLTVVFEYSYVISSSCTFLYK